MGMRCFSGLFVFWSVFLEDTCSPHCCPALRRGGQRGRGTGVCVEGKEATGTRKMLPWGYCESECGLVCVFWSMGPSVSVRVSVCRRIKVQRRQKSHYFRVSWQTSKKLNHLPFLFPLKALGMKGFQTWEDRGKEGLVTRSAQPGFLPRTNFLKILNCFDEVLYLHDSKSKTTFKSMHWHAPSIPIYLSCGFFLDKNKQMMNIYFYSFYFLNERQRAIYTILHLAF